MTSTPDKTCALILAAGFSERMGAFKPMLPLGDTNPLRRLIRMYRRAGVADVFVVSGHRADAVETEAARAGATCIRNPHPENGMFSSVAAGVAGLPGEAGRTFVHPVDTPLVRTDTVELLLRESAAAKCPALVPVFDDVPGHPPLIAHEVFADILAGAGEGGLRALLERWNPRRVETADRQILFDIDTPSHYEEAKKRVTDPVGLTPGEAKKLLRVYFRAPPPLLAHTRTVATLTVALGKALWDQGVALDEGLAVCGAWLHDLAKGRPKHHKIGAARLSEMGFAAIAKVVEKHSCCSWPDGKPFDERALVALADKLVKDDRAVGLERRFAAKLALYADDPAAAAAMRERLWGATMLANRFEVLARRSVDDICRKVNDSLENALPL